METTKEIEEFIVKVGETTPHVVQDIRWVVSVFGLKRAKFILDTASVLNVTVYKFTPLKPNTVKIEPEFDEMYDRYMMQGDAYRDTVSYEEYKALTEPLTHRDTNVGTSNYADMKIQPWDIWRAHDLDPWRADIVKRLLRTKGEEDPVEDLRKIQHICQELISQLENGYDARRGK